MVEVEQNELAPQIGLDFAMWEHELAPSPAEYLASIPYEGFNPEQHQELIDQIVAIGLPVENYTSLARKPNERGTENHLGSWGIGTDNYGEFSVYERLEHEIPEARLDTIAHEGAHANTPLRRENAHLFGGEKERAEAELFTKNLAGQTLITGKYLTGYHKYLANQLVQGEITADIFAEETQAIATALALSNRAKLEQVEAVQHSAMADLRRAGKLSSDLPTVNLLSHTDKNGVVEVGGIDKQLIALLRGVSDYDSLLKHIGSLKAHFYPEETLAVANERFGAQQQMIEFDLQSWVMLQSRIAKKALRHLFEPDIKFEDDLELTPVW